MLDAAVLGAPLYTLSSYRGMGEAPGSLRKAGLVAAVGAQTDLGDVGIPPLKEDVLEGRVKNLSHFIAATSSIYSALRKVDSGRVIVIGGECSETVGAMAGLAEAFGGKAGMLWLDAHGDFNTPDTSPSGYIGGMCLALACGRSPDLGLPHGKGAPLAEERLVHVGSRALDPPEAEAFASSPARLFTSRQVRERGIEGVAVEVARRLADRSDWIACHLDVDVIDPEFVPSVNYPTPGGLKPDECSAIIRALDETGKLRALEVTAYNRSNEAAEASAKVITGVLRRALDQTGRGGPPRVEGSKAHPR